MVAKYELIKYPNGMSILFYDINYLKAIPHWHNEIEIIFVISGTLECIISGDTFCLNKNEIAIVNCEQIHSCISSKEKTTQILLLQINEQLFKSLNIDLSSIHFVNQISTDIQSDYYHENCEALIKLSKKLASIIPPKKDSNQSAINLLCCNIISMLPVDDSYAATSDRQLAIKNNQINRIKNIFAYVEKMYREDISLEDLASSENFSPYYLSHTFKKYTNTTFTQYLNSYRISMIQKDLRNTSDSITEIYLRHGFGNNKTFNRTFHKLTGCSPSEYRNNSATASEEFHVIPKNETIDTGIGTYIYYNSPKLNTGKYLLSGQIDEEAHPALAANTESKRILITASTSKRQFKKYFLTTTSTGRAHDILLAKWRQQFEVLQNTLHFQYIRFHGIFNDEIGIITRFKETYQYNFFYIDDIFDYLLSQGCKPYIELGFMPEVLKSDEQTIYFYKGHTCPPSSLSKWIELIQAFMEHIIGRYGRAEVLTWFFEVWNEADLKDFWSGTIEQYLELYEATVKTIKAYDQGFKTGGPAASSAVYWDYNILPDFLTFCSAKRIPLDFISVHCYPVSFRVLPESKNKRRIYHDINDLTRNFDWIYTQLSGTVFTDVPIHITEWNSSPFANDYIHDTAFMATFILHNVIANIDRVEQLVFWELSDLLDEDYVPFNEFGGKYGLMNRSGLKKPSFFALQALSRLSDEILSWGSDYIVTKSQNCYQILCFNHCHYSDDFTSGKENVLSYYDRYSIFEQGQKRQFQYTIVEQGDFSYEIVKYQFDRENGSIYDFWLKNGAPEYLTASQLTFFQANNHLKQSIEYRSCRDFLILNAEVEPLGFILYEIKRL
ncbi:GH39 family glycosyl hydrolase [Anaerocolumna sp. MB42-C2]|uniref:GH39 family glycosyl hydrolase n=1 Tax=Anaerocolumna sp. MB42-C2 TaxID=3070997 RepID=UPI0027DFF4C1|nr:helix-turn-helix domain-containing protein [Anaerocolumna sp. MB42-C2]WMJ89060.1 helix-turn-helix domain-containing protein [Anaerocolumna sp. MB42-C2]